MADVLVEPRPAEYDASVRENTALERRLTLAITVAPFVGLIVAVSTLWARGIGMFEVVLAVVTYLMAGLGVTIGYHRLFAHGSFKANRVTKIALAICGGLAIEGGVIGWVATHRRHHATSDTADDPHSPHREETEGVRGVLRGLWYAQVGWLFEPKTTPVPRWAPDLLKDRDLARIDKLFPLWATISLAGPALIGLVVTRSFSGAVSAFLWAGLVRAFFVHHVTWSINSICHFYGSRPFESRDLSTNNWVLSLLSLGESWHNNHHAFPNSARHGLGRWQVDISASIIRGLQWLGMADDVKIPTPEQMAKRRRVESTA